MFKLYNFIAFQVGWLACVITAAMAYPWLGTGFALLLLLLHLKLIAQPRSELLLILVVGLLGGLWDSALLNSGVLVFASNELLPYAAPHWIVALWALFASTLNVSLDWLKARRGLAAVLGAVAGPAAYYAGHRLGGVEFTDLPSALMILSLGWAVMTPALLTLALRLQAPESPATASV